MNGAFDGTTALLCSGIWISFCQARSLPLKELSYAVV